MRIRTTVTLDDDVLDRVKRESRVKGATFRDTIDDLLRTALVKVDNKPQRRTLRIQPTRMGYKPGLNYDSESDQIQRRQRRPGLIVCDEFPAGYSSADCSPAGSASASPTVDHLR